MPASPSRPNANCDFCRWVTEAGKDPRFADAQWQWYRDTYVKWAMQNKPAQFKSALTIGVLIDAAVNAGSGDEPGGHWGVLHLASASTGGTEAEWVSSVLDLRERYPVAESEPGAIRKRADAWRRLAAAGKWDMRGDITSFVMCWGACPK